MPESISIVRLLILAAGVVVVLIAVGAVIAAVAGTVRRK